MRNNHEIDAQHINDYKDAVGRASNAVLSAKDRDLIAQRLAMERLLNVITNNPNGLQNLLEIQKGE